MTKIIILILGTTMLIACNSSTQKDKSGTNQIANSEKTEEPKPNLNGVWGLTNYLDTIVQNKEVAKYRLQAPSWFGILPMEANGA